MKRTMTRRDQIINVLFENDKKVKKKKRLAWYNKTTRCLVNDTKIENDMILVSDEARPDIQAFNM